MTSYQPLTKTGIFGNFLNIFLFFLKIFGGMADFTGFQSMDNPGQHIPVVNLKARDILWFLVLLRIKVENCCS
jgi:hypothetical protein